jgi:hypothetical protein
LQSNFRRRRRRPCRQANTLTNGAVQAHAGRQRAVVDHADDEVGELLVAMQHGSRRTRLKASGVPKRRILITHRCPAQMLRPAIRQFGWHPSALKNLKVWVEPRIRAEGSHYMLDLLLFYSGQLPLQFKTPRGRGINVGLLEGMDRLAARIEAALARSNDVWSLAAEIINTEVDPADEVEQVRLTSGYPVPNRGRRSKVPEILQLLSRHEALPLFTPEMRPEYVESGQLTVTAAVALNNDRLRLCVEEARSVDPESSIATRVRPKDRLAPRWTDPDPRPWILLAWVAKFMDMPMATRGHAVISVDTLDPKALEVQGSENAAQIVMKLIEFLKPVIESQSVSVGALACKRSGSCQGHCCGACITRSTSTTSPATQ